MAEQLVLRGTLEGHSGWVTSLATSLEKWVSPKYLDADDGLQLEKTAEGEINDHEAMLTTI
jgi:hypothetical protein